MADQVLTRDGPVPVPMDYPVPAGGELIPLSVIATVDGTAAASAFYATVQVIAPSGRVMCSAITSAIAAGGSATVTWFPWWRGVSTTPTPSPNPLGTLWAWYDFADASTVTLDGSGNISAVSDKTGLGHNVAQGVAAQRPGTALVNGLTAGLFAAASSQGLTGGPYSDALSVPYSIALVFTQDQAPFANNWPGPLMGRNQPDEPVLFLNNGNSVLVMEAGAPSITKALSAPFTQQQVTMLFNGASSSFRLNAAATAGTTAPTAISEVGLGAQRQPSKVGENDFMTGKLCEVLIYVGVLTAAQISAVEAYLKAKWGTP